MKYIFLILSLLLLVSPTLSIAQSATGQDSITAVITADTVSQDNDPASEDDYSRYARKGPKDNIWKLSLGLSLLLMVIVLMLIMKRKKK